MNYSLSSNSDFKMRNTSSTVSSSRSVFSISISRGAVNTDFSRIDADGFNSVNHPSVDFISELVQIDVFILRAFIQLTEHVDSVLSQHTGQFDIQTAFTNSQRYLFRFRRNTSALRSSSFNRIEEIFGRAQCTLDKQ